MCIRKYRRIFNKIYLWKFFNIYGIKVNNVCVDIELFILFVSLIKYWFLKIILVLN